MLNHARTISTGTVTRLSFYLLGQPQILSSILSGLTFRLLYGFQAQSERVTSVKGSLTRRTARSQQHHKFPLFLPVGLGWKYRD